MYRKTNKVRYDQCDKWHSTENYSFKKCVQNSDRLGKFDEASYAKFRAISKNNNKQKLNIYKKSPRETFQ